MMNDSCKNYLFQRNTPDLWIESFPCPRAEGHKYDRGHAVIYGAPELTGATRLAASACSRMGAGLVSVLVDQKVDLYRTVLPADIMVRETGGMKRGGAKSLKNVSVALGGSGGISDVHQKKLLDNDFQSARVFDADALPVFGDFEKLDSLCVLTPHEGEFERVFPDIKGDSREDRATQAAALCGSVLVLKGAQTIIADPMGRCVENNHASPYLAKAGTGDVLAGMIAGLIGQGMPVFEASCAAVWIHGEAGQRCGAGLVASDLSDILPFIFKDLLKKE